MIVEIQVNPFDDEWQLIYSLLDDTFANKPQTLDIDEYYNTKEEALAKAKKLYNEQIEAKNGTPITNF